MAEQENTEEAQVESKKSSSMPMIAGGAIAVLVLLAAFFFFSSGNGSSIEEAKPVVEYMVKPKMYQLKDGSYLNLGFAIVVEEDKVSNVKYIVEKESPGKLPNGINMIVGNKSREDLINGTHKREAFSREIKKMLEERVFEAYNKKQRSAQDTIEVKGILISDFVTQSG